MCVFETTVTVSLLALLTETGSGLQGRIGSNVILSETLRNQSYCDEAPRAHLS